MVKPIAVAALLVSVPVVALSGCTPNQHPSTQPGTTPPVKSGSPASSTPASTAAPDGQMLQAQLETPDGKPAAAATFQFANGYATITVKTIGIGILPPGFHPMHIHEIGKCEPNSVAPTGGPPGNFLSAGDHYQAPGHTGMPASGNLPSLEVRQDGGALLVTTSDAFTRDDLLSGNKTAIMVHGAEGSDNAEQRIACGVIGAG